MVLFVVQAFTGALMAFYYDPSPEGAYPSVDYIQFILPFGWLVRGVHHWAASAMVIIVVLHLLRTYLYGAYKKPREFTWLVGVVLLLITVSFGFTGYLLPWDQKGFWATQVGTEIAGSVPLIGAGIRDLMRGGAEMGIATLTRFYATHMLLLPGAFILLVLAHLGLMRRHGLAPALIRKGNEPEKTVPFYPTHLAIEAGIALVVIVGLVVAANQFPAPLDLRSDPTDTNFVPRPDWYFLFFFQLLTYFPGQPRSNRHGPHPALLLRFARPVAVLRSKSGAKALEEARHVGRLRGLCDRCDPPDHPGRRLASSAGAERIRGTDVEAAHRPGVRNAGARRRGSLRRGQGARRSRTTYLRRRERQARSRATTLPGERPA